ncbi:delta-aminolevulinic acid dehydratase, chloroplastic-like [Phoenix dactylifera]|uniref:Delta-aminolevulinic acid dehydratase n=1 Tax=Phoenix dactylifera TaxID=42345 RepID=A0A8B9AIG5_PHODC|nr:delta-aminolevulinic acid dehydratase, chloroplastic-like [Phoenix dactylifera]
MARSIVAAGRLPSERKASRGAGVKDPQRHFLVASIVNESHNIESSFPGNKLVASNFMFPLCSHEGEVDVPVGPMPGCYRLCWRYGLLEKVYKAQDVGVNGFLQTRDEAFNDNGLVPQAICLLKDKYPDIFIFSFSPKCLSGLFDKSYQMNLANYREAPVETEADEDEGADILLVKPAMPYLDVVWLLQDNSALPFAAYQVSGEYSMIKAGGAYKMVGEEKVMKELLLCIRQAGADITLCWLVKLQAIYAHEIKVD